ncbi:MAG: PIN domain-containing protein [Chloroherpetonaceae bacterium]|nr:PIN domain-containing protein [Chloroherpetonaceae bacterium]MCS7211798.1 PIN domain-containing protein [Chloroherpetonaceae bacterium]MDW8020557.1 PIN domain-containing protein [Chloroherpetonaceae bacterium]MDW8464804.1 PIN domain-containing protein [Chloroherpetonaceae bacterium]
MKYLVDTNVFLEVLCEQQKADAAEHFLKARSARYLCCSVFSLDSIGIILHRQKKMNVFRQFVQDLVSSNLNVLGLMPSEYLLLEESISKWGLDFDDAYQYTLAKKHGLELVSFDADFDRTDLKRIEPQ